MIIYQPYNKRPDRYVHGLREKKSGRGQRIICRIAFFIGVEHPVPFLYPALLFGDYRP
jgi:hypothetical protein